ncbi:Cystatin domain [Sesbania bispinosa]|nr:Cystatin domain [Sesbania bispinosa]
MRQLNGVVILLLSLWLLSAAQKGEGLLGDWRPVNVTDPHVVSIANFSVTEYDKRSHAKLNLVRVVVGDSQLVSGTRYRLVLAAKNGSVIEYYKARVLEKPWLHFRNLTCFKTSLGGLYMLVIHFLILSCSL